MGDGWCLGECLGGSGGIALGDHFWEGEHYMHSTRSFYMHVSFGGSGGIWKDRSGGSLLGVGTLLGWERWEKEGHLGAKFSNDH